MVIALVLSSKVSHTQHISRLGKNFFAASQSYWDLCKKEVHSHLSSNHGAVFSDFLSVCPTLGSAQNSYQGLDISQGIIEPGSLVWGRVTLLMTPHPNGLQQQKSSFAPCLKKGRRGCAQQLLRDPARQRPWIMQTGGIRVRGRAEWSTSIKTPPPGSDMPLTFFWLRQSHMITANSNKEGRRNRPGTLVSNHVYQSLVRVAGPCSVQFDSKTSTEEASYRNCKGVKCSIWKSLSPCQSLHIPLALAERLKVISVAPLANLSQIRDQLPREMMMCGRSKCWLQVRMRGLYVCVSYCYAQENSCSHPYSLQFNSSPQETRDPRNHYNKAKQQSNTYNISRGWRSKTVLEFYCE